MDLLKQYWKSKYSVFKFFSYFLVCIVLFYGIYYSIFFQDYLKDPILFAQTSISAALLSVLGFVVNVQGDSLSGMNILVKLSGGCDGLEATALLLAALSLFPIPFKYKWPGLLVGAITLSLLNIFRIVGLFLVALYQPDFFEFMHIQGGLYLFSFVGILIVIIWSDWALKRFRAELDLKQQRDNLSTPLL